jgi:hypothetical protein
MPAESRESLSTRFRAPAAIALIALSVAVSGCGKSDLQTNSATLEKPALTIPQGSVEASASTKKTGATGSTSTTSTDSSDSSDTSGTDTGADTGTDTGGADTGTDGGAGTDTGADTGTDTGGAGPGN